MIDSKVYIPSDEKHGDGLSANLENGSNAEDPNSDEETVSTTESIAHRGCKKSA
jgi:hypothetical protein